jgi:hypothetical protein
MTLLFFLTLFLLLLLLLWSQRRPLTEAFTDEEEEEETEIILFNVPKGSKGSKGLKAEEETEIFMKDELLAEKNESGTSDRIKKLEKEQAELKALLLNKNNQANKNVMEGERAAVKEANKVATAVAKAILNGDKVSHVNIIDAGSNYAQAPTVGFSGGNGSGAQALAKVRDGHVVAIELTAGGKGYTSPPQIVFNREAFCGTNPVESVKTVEKKAAAFNKIHNAHVQDVEKRVAEAKVKWAPMLKTLEEDKKITAQAKKLGFPPPPSLYTDQQLKDMQKELNLKPRVLTVKQKAKCMDLSNETKKVVESVEFLTRQGIDIPALRPDAQNKAELLEKLKAEYKNNCA